MKKLILLAVLVMSSAIFAQEKHANKTDKMKHLKDLSPEQIATLRTKNMTLTLDLSKEQSDKIYALNLEDANTRKAQRTKRTQDKNSEQPKLSSEEKFNRMNNNLDHKIAHKNKMKSILSEEQFKKWSHMTNRKDQKRRKTPRNNR